MTTVNSLIPKILNYCKENNLFNNIKPKTIFIRTSSIIKEKYYGKKIFEFIPLEIVIFKNSQYKYRFTEDNNFAKALTFDDQFKLYKRKFLTLLSQKLNRASFINIYNIHLQA